MSTLEQCPACGSHDTMHMVHCHGCGSDYAGPEQINRNAGKPTDEQPTDWWTLIECSLIVALLIYVMYLIPA